MALLAAFSALPRESLGNSTQGVDFSKDKTCGASADLRLYAAHVSDNARSKFAPRMTAIFSLEYFRLTRPSVRS